jgi:hypothetical protein
MKTASLLAIAITAFASTQLPVHAQTIVTLGTASTYGVLAGTTVTSTGLTVVKTVISARAPAPRSRASLPAS